MTSFRKILVLFSFLLGVLSLYSQINYYQTPEDETYIARQHIKRLHDSSILLVRLHSREKSIQAYRNSGKDKFADKKELEQNAYNLAIVKAFRENFNFCEVYFYYSDKTSDNIDDRFMRLVFLNDSLQEDQSILPNFGMYYHYVAEFRIVNSETMIQGLAIMDTQLNQLKKPFPYYAKSPFFATHKKTPFITVKRFNRKLHRYYKRVK
ncbi:MAG: hypothetical protein JXR36_12605 [Bacteroidales bacterium]|nr:hypothetical protein [Bacteroidales bacterium]